MYNCIMKKEIIENVFTKEEISLLHKTIDDAMSSRDHVYYGGTRPKGFMPKTSEVRYFGKTARIDIQEISFPESIVNKLTEIANRYSRGYNLRMVETGGHYAEYTGLLGTPDLGPHYDGGGSDFMLDYQLDSNVSWGIGMDEDVYELKNNDALTLYPLSYIHYRPKKKLDNDQYVKMIFFRFAETSDAPQVISPEVSPEKHERISQIYNHFYDKENNAL